MGDFDFATLDSFLGAFKSNKDLKDLLVSPVFHSKGAPIFVKGFNRCLDYAFKEHDGLYIGVVPVEKRGDEEYVIAPYVDDNPQIHITKEGHLEDICVGQIRLEQRSEHVQKSLVAIESVGSYGSACPAAA